MPNIKSAKKRVIVNNKRADRNKSRNTALKTAIKKANAAIESNAADKEVLVKAAVKKIDQASAKGLIHMPLAKSQPSFANSTRLNVVFNAPRSLDRGVLLFRSNLHFIH